MEDVAKLCFLCFQKSLSNDSSSFKTISLQSVLHYINTGGGDKDDNENCGGGGDQVVVCHECSNVANKLSQLCIKLQEIQLNIEYYLEKFSDKLNGQGEKGRNDSWNEQALKLYRKHIYQKCKSKLGSKRHPVVPLEKLKIVPKAVPVHVPVSQAAEQSVKGEEGPVHSPPLLDIEPPTPPSPQPPPELENDPLADDNDNLLESEEFSPEPPPFSFEMGFFEEEPVTSAIIKPPPPSTVNDTFHEESIEPFEHVRAALDDSWQESESPPPSPLQPEAGAEVTNADEDLHEFPPVLTQEDHSPNRLNKKRKRGRPRVHPPNLTRNSGASPKNDKRMNRTNNTTLSTEPCQTCGAKFTCKWQRRNHMYTHRLPRTLGLKNAGKSNQVKCPNCTTRTTWIRGGDFQLELHNYIFHLDLVFKCSKSPDLSLPQFKDYCNHLLNCEGVASKVKVKGSGSFKGYTCQNCGKLFKVFASLRSHLISKHKPILSRKLEQLQSEISVEKLKEVMCPPVRDDKKCEKCGATFSKNGGLNRHLKESCPFRKDKSVKSHKPCRCQECGMRFGVTVSFYRHRRKEHPGSVKPPILLK